jgi:hypothetical protein
MDKRQSTYGGFGEKEEKKKREFEEVGNFSDLDLG